MRVEREATIAGKARMLVSSSNENYLDILRSMLSEWNLVEMCDNTLCYLVDEMDVLIFKDAFREAKGKIKHSLPTKEYEARVCSIARMMVSRWLEESMELVFDGGMPVWFSHEFERLWRETKLDTAYMFDGLRWNTSRTFVRAVGESLARSEVNRNPEYGILKDLSLQ